MISFGIIVFREVLEVALVLSILMVGTAGMSGRARWLWSGLCLGTVGASLVAVFIGKISSALEGSGQEVFHAAVLLLAAVLIGCTVVWMQRQAKSITCELKKVTADIRAGTREISVLTAVVGLSVLRDGSEIILLGHGVAATGVSFSSIFFGSLLGLGMGSLVGYGIYLGLLKAATGRIFSITTFMLTIVAASMVSQAIGFLSSVDILPTIMYPVWDTSKIVSEGGYLGQFLHILCGYIARPSAIQLFGYLGTILLISLALNYPTRAIANSAAIFAIVVGACATISSAHGIDKIYSPMVEYKELEFETRGKYDYDHRADRNAGFQELFGVGYGFTQRFAAEGYMEVEREPEEDTNVQAFSLEGRYQLTEQGEYWIDPGLYLEVERDIQENAYQVEGKILLEKSTGPLTHTLNIIFEREGLGSEGSDVEWGTAFKSRYRMAPEFEPGFELFDNLGEIPDMGGWSEQEHSIGPAIYGKIFGKIKYELAYLFGISTEAPDQTVRWTVEYEVAL